MEKYFHYKISNSSMFKYFIQFIVFMGCSCTPTAQPEIKKEEYQPIWETRLPGEAGIYNDGLIGFPIYGNNILFHSTYFINNDGEDNRIHALNMETGEIAWTFPIVYNEEKPMLFSGEPFLYNEFVVTKMRKYGSVSTSKLICVNQRTGLEYWCKVIPSSLSYNINNCIVGDGSDFYYFVQSEKNAILYRGNVISGDTTKCFQINPELGYNYTNVTSNVIYVKDRGLLLAGAWERDTSNSDINSSKNYLYIIDAKDNRIIQKVYTNFLDNTMLISNVYCKDHKVFMSCGLTTICYNLDVGKIDWFYKSADSYNFMTNKILVSKNVVFLYGDNRYSGLDANLGKIIYQGDVQCGNANISDGFAYIIGRDSKLYMIDIETGKVLYRVTCPEESKSHTGFNTFCKPQVYGDKLYVFGNYHAYCYHVLQQR